METYLPLEASEQAEFQQIVLSDQDYEEVGQMMTVYEKRGVEKGKQEGKQEDLLLLLEKKFGQLSDPVRRKVRDTQSPEKLDQLLLAVLDAESLEDMPF